MAEASVWPQMIIAVATSALASTGFWAFIQKRCDTRECHTDMLVGLGHDRIIFLGMSYIERGWITQEEYENLHDYLFKPYEALGGNGSAKRIMQEVNKLPIRKSSFGESEPVGK